VAWYFSPGSYARRRLIGVDQVVTLPDAIAFETAASVLGQGLTAHAMVNSAYRVREGETVLVHGAAGGVAHQVVQLCKRVGARVIGTVSTPEKAAYAREDGADHVIRYDQDDFAKAVAEITGGGVDVVFDGVGATTVGGSLDCLRPRGTLVLYGNAAGPVPPLDTQPLFDKSLYLTRPRIVHYLGTRAEVKERADALFEELTNGTLKVRVHRRLPLADAARAHESLADRKVAGKLLLIP
jgi:NADPH:quinone reductase